MSWHRQSFPSSADLTHQLTEHAEGDEDDDERDPLIIHPHFCQLSALPLPRFACALLVSCAASTRRLISVQDHGKSTADVKHASTQRPSWPV